jgi:hypothetical protein
MLHASGTRKISQPRSKDSKARQAGPMQSDLQRNAVDLCVVDGGASEETREMAASARVPNMAALLGIVLVWSIASTAVGAHESWINRGGYRNSAGE